MAGGRKREKKQEAREVKQLPFKKCQHYPHCMEYDRGYPYRDYTDQDGREPVKKMMHGSRKEEQQWTGQK